MNRLLKFPNPKDASSFLGLALEGSRLEAIEVRRANDSLQPGKQLTATLSLDPLTAEPELVGREILNHLETAGIRERRCVVALPLKWMLTAYTRIPSLPESDVPGFLQIEAERGFATDVDALQVCTSRLTAASGELFATFVGVPRSHIERLEQVLRAARLKPVSFTLGITAAQPAGADAKEGVLALLIAENHVGFQITCGGGVAALRAIENAADGEPVGHSLQPDLIAREARITLGQLAPELRNEVRKVRIFGPRTVCQRLADDVRPRLNAAGVEVETISSYPPDTFGRTIPVDMPISPAFSVAARQLTGPGDRFEFLPPKVSALEQMTARYVSRRWRGAAAAAAVVIVLAAGMLAVQEWQLTRLRSQWQSMSAKVNELNEIQDQIQKYRPWFDDSCRYLSILKQLATAFTDDGSVTAKSVEIRELPESGNISVISCSGNAANYSALQKTVHQLSAIPGVTELNVPTRGKTPIQFTFDFHLSTGGPHEN